MINLHGSLLWDFSEVFTRMGTDTYRKLGIPYALGDIDTPSPEHMEACRDIVAQHLERVVW